MKGCVLRALVLILVVSSTPLAMATEAPVAASPGSSSGTLIAGSCPTFSWGQVAGAESYELIVYGIGDDGQEAETVLHQRIPGAVGSWTPSLNDCLSPDAQYAWTVRAVGRKGEPYDWSSPNLFKVAPLTSEADFAEALSIVRRYLAAHGDLLGPTSGTVGSLPGVERDSLSSSPSRDRLSSQAPAETLLSVDGNVDAVSFSGDGSALTNLPVSGDCQTGGRYEDNGDGTVTDCRSGLIWLKQASCATLAGGNGRAEWSDALAAVSTLGDGQCGLTDGSEAGLWRLPTITEWMAMVANARRLGFTAPTMTNAEGSGQWTEGDPFLGVQALGGGNWSSTEIDSSSAYDLKLVDGSVDPDGKAETNWVWPVRDGPPQRIRVRTGVPTAFCLSTDIVLAGGCDCAGRGVSVSTRNAAETGWTCTCTGSPFNGAATAFCLMVDG